VYQITAAGRAELDDWVRELVSTPERERPRFMAGLSMLAALSPSEALELLERRLGLLREDLQHRAAALSRDAESVSRLFLVESEYALALLKAEAEWVDSLVAELRDGSFPGIDQWGAASGGAALAPAEES
jgi:hypothetical protein